MLIDLSPFIQSLQRIEANQLKIMASLAQLEQPVEVPIIPPAPVEAAPEIPEVVEEVPEVDLIDPTWEVIDFTDEFYRLVYEAADIYLEERKTYWVKQIHTTEIVNRKLRIYSGPDRANLLFGVENYSPFVHKTQDGLVFMMGMGGILILDNVNPCQPKQLRTVENWNPRLVSSVQEDKAIWTVIIRNADTTALGKNGGMGIGLIYGGLGENHLALLNFKHHGTGLMDAKNPYKDSVMYITTRAVEAYALTDATEELSGTDFEHIGSLSNGVLSFDGSVYSLTSGYNFRWRDNDSYLILWDRFTFFLDGYLSDTILADNQFRIRPQASGLCEFGVLNTKTIYSNSLEMHAGDQFEYQGEVFTVMSKDRIAYPFFDARTTDSIREPDRARAITYELDKELTNLKAFPVSPVLKLKNSENILIVIAEANKAQLVLDMRTILDPTKDQELLSLSDDQLFEVIKTTAQVRFDEIEIHYLSDQIEFTDQPITLVYRTNGGFKTTTTTTYRAAAMLSSRGIGHLTYNQAKISWNDIGSELFGRHRGSKTGLGTSIIWNLSQTKGLEEDPLFQAYLPITHIPNLPLHPRIQELL